MSEQKRQELLRKRYRNWASLRQEDFGTELEFIRIRNHMWNLYCDARDSVPEGTNDIHGASAEPAKPKRAQRSLYIIKAGEGNESGT